MRLYQKAYHLRELRKFAGWRDPTTPLPDEAIVYLGDDYAVTQDIFEDSAVLFSSSGADWKEFCQRELGFAPPAPTD